jgi:hypothetical protein
MVHQHYSNQDDYQNDPIVQRILARVPAEISKTFTDPQLAELKKIFVDRMNNSSAVDVRLSIPFFQRRFYLVCLMGKEKRSLHRLKNSKFKVINSFVSTTYILLMLSIIVLGSAYMIQEKLRIDSFKYTPSEKVKDFLQDNP